MNKQKQSLRRLREMMRELLNTRYQGADAVTISRAQGLADGYMRALSDMGVVKEWELLDLIADERRRLGEHLDRPERTMLRSSNAAPSLV